MNEVQTGPLCLHRMGRQLTSAYTQSQGLVKMLKQDKFLEHVGMYCIKPVDAR